MRGEGANISYMERQPTINTKQEQLDSNDIEFGTQESYEIGNQLKIGAAISASVLHIEPVLANTFFERKFATKVTEAVTAGIENPVEYETYKVHEYVFSPAKKIWLSFPGLGVLSENYNIDIPNIHSITPREGVGCIFEGPAGIAGTSPEQCMDTTDRVLKTVVELIEKYANYEINVVGFSAGTHLAHYVTNSLGELYQEQKVKKLISIASGMSIGMGIFSTNAVKPLYEKLYADGMDKYRYTEAITGYNPKDNTTWLPQGDDLQIWYGEWDRFIPPDKEGGTKELATYLTKLGKRPKIVKSRWKDHTTIIASIAIQEFLGIDVFDLGIPPLNWIGTEYEESYSTIVLDRVNALGSEELYRLALHITRDMYNFGVGNRDYRLRPRSTLKGGDEILANILLGKGILKTHVTGRDMYFYMLSESAYAYWSANPFKHMFVSFLQYGSSAAGIPSVNSSLVNSLMNVKYILKGTQIYVPDEEMIKKREVRINARREREMIDSKQRAS